MSLKQETTKIFEEYGLNEQQIQIMLAYLSNSQATVSMISGLLEVDYNTVKETTEKLVSEGFLAKIEGQVTRYIPLEPYFSLFVKQSSTFREQIEKIKDAVLQDQSKRFKELDGIKDRSLEEVDSAVENQVNEFFRVSDEHDADKNNVIMSAKERFTNEAKQLESGLHERIEKDYTELDSDVKQMDADAAKTWDDHATKFTNDNNNLNTTLDEISDSHVDSTKQLEQNLHGIIDNLNGQLKGIADGFVSKYQTGIESAKEGINKIIADLLKDFAERVSNLETEIKKDLDNHVENHKENAQALKPSLEEILAKYMDRMHNVVEDLKRRITKLLLEHTDHLKSTTNKMQDRLKSTVDTRQDELEGQVKSFEENTIVLIDNLQQISGNLGDLGEVLASRGSAFKALFLKRHKEWVALSQDIQERVTKLSGDMKDDFTASTQQYIQNTEKTKDNLKGEIESVLIGENNGLKENTEALDKKAQNTVNAELEGLASELSTEIDDTLKGNIQHCKDTTVKLKDSVQSSFATHKENFDGSINRHNKNSLDHYNDCDHEVKLKVDGWYSEMDKDHNKAKNDITTEAERQITDINKHRNNTKNKNVEHSETFESDKEATKKKQKEIYDNRLAKIRGDFDTSKKETSDMINKEIELYSNECKEADDKLHAMLEDHKSKYQENATTLQQSLKNTINDTIKDTRDAIADFTLDYMNNIDEGTELAESNEEKLTDIFNASKEVVDVSEIKTWHLVGMDAIMEYINDSLKRVKSIVIIVTHQVIPKILETLGQAAYENKRARYRYITHWTPEFEPFMKKMKVFGNIQFRQLRSAGEFIAMSRESEEVLLAPIVADEKNIISIVSTEPGYCKLYKEIIGPVFLGNSRPV
ncbi:MAG: hypothetical protein GF364_08645 [Candidatus Lokiarchaeota archaeon]|nr:hypothetical protein [Candidatus Lokiarchaeota archaeon]